MSVSFSTIIQKLRAKPNATTSLLNEYIAKMQPTVMTPLQNGVRVASEPSARSEFATVGVWIDCGSRFETRDNNGVSNILQRMALRGTGTYNRQALSAAVEELGGHLHVHTKRDQTAFYVKCLSADVPKAVALLAEFVRNPVISDESLDIERNIALGNLKDLEELQEQQCFDNLHLAAYDTTDNGLAHAPQGTVESLKNLNTAKVNAFRSDNWIANRVLLVGSGGVQHTQLEGLAKQYFGDMRGGPAKPKVESRYVGGDIKLWNLRMKVTHVAWAVETCGASCGDIVPLQLVNHLYGRFHRSQHDLVSHPSQIALKSYSSMDHCTPTNTHMPEKGIECVTPFLHAYEDTGLFGMYMVCRPEPTGPGGLDNIFGYVQYTLGDVCRLTQKLCHPQELEQAKVNYKAQLLMNSDGHTLNAEDIARQVLQYGRRVPLEEMYARIDDVTPSNVMETLQHYFYSRRPVLSYVGYNYMTPGYDQVCHWTYKFLY